MIDKQGLDTTHTKKDDLHLHTPFLASRCPKNTFELWFLTWDTDATSCHLTVSRKLFFNGVGWEIVMVQQVSKIEIIDGERIHQKNKVKNKTFIITSINNYKAMDHTLFCTSGTPAYNSSSGELKDSGFFLDPSPRWSSEFARSVHLHNKNAHTSSLIYKQQSGYILKLGLLPNTENKCNSLHQVPN